MKDSQLEHPDITRMCETGYPFDRITEFPHCSHCGSETDTYMINKITNEIEGCGECIVSRDAWEMVPETQIELPRCPNCDGETDTYMIDAIRGKVVGCDDCIKECDAWEIENNRRYGVDAWIM